MDFIIKTTSLPSSWWPCIVIKLNWYFYQHFNFLSDAGGRGKLLSKQRRMLFWYWHDVVPTFQFDCRVGWCRMSPPPIGKAGGDVWVEPSGLKAQLGILYLHARSIPWSREMVCRFTVTVCSFSNNVLDIESVIVMVACGVFQCMQLAPLPHSSTK